MAETGRAWGAWIWEAGRFVSCAGVPLADRGFRYGMALFESLAVRGGRVEFLAAHLARLRDGCGLLGWTLEEGAPEGRVLEGFEGVGKMAEAILAACGPGPEFARLYITAGEGGPAASVNAPRIYLFSEPRAAGKREPYRVIVAPAAHQPLLGGLKTANYWANAAHYAAALHAGADEALLFNPAGELISASMANVFLEIGGEWVTPPGSTGARRGVIREWVLKRLPVTERIIIPTEIEKATGGFLTSSWNGVMPVGRLNSRPLETTVAEQLSAEFFKDVRE